jgi:hypothetical protein
MAGGETISPDHVLLEEEPLGKFVSRQIAEHNFLPVIEKTQNDPAAHPVLCETVISSKNGEYIRAGVSMHEHLTIISGRAHPKLAGEIASYLGIELGRVDIWNFPDGEIGLITTGAGLSMQLIDELVSQGRKPLNFCDIRSGQFRGDPARLIAVMRWMAARPRVGVVLVNIFAGITDLGEFARLLVQAAALVPELRVPIIARLIGRNLDAAKRVLSESGLAVTVEPDLERAVELTVAVLDRKGARRG